MTPLHKNIIKVVLALTLFTLAFLIMLVVVFSLLAQPVSAEVLVYGSTYNYTENLRPNNSYVHQGDNIYQGYYYQLGGVYGFSGQLAHWDNKWNEGDSMPDDIVEISSSPYSNTYIDPKIFPEGRWYQWDGQYCDADGYCKYGFGHGNSFVFAVVKPNISVATVKPTTVPIVRKSNISIQSGNEVIEIPVTTPTSIMVEGTVEPVPNTTTIMIQKPVTPTPVVESIEIVTPKSPVNVIVPVVAVMVLVFVWRRKS